MRVEDADMPAMPVDAGTVAATRTPSGEKAQATSTSSPYFVPLSLPASTKPPPPSSSFSSKLHDLNARLESLAGFEARGIARVLPEERQPPSLASDLQLAVLWFSVNITLNNLAVGFLGPMVFSLGFLDSALLAVFGAFVGTLSTAYMSVWGPVSGNRTMVVLRYFMGYWPSKVPCFLNIILMVGYCTIDGIIGGQVLSAVSGGKMSIAVGIVVVSIVCWVVAVCGMSVFQKYERFAWLPQIIALFALIGCASPHFNPSTTSQATGAALAASRLSFFSLCLYLPASWAAAASDFYVYYPENTAKTKTFLLTFVGAWLAFCLVLLIGIGIASGIPNNPAWGAAYDVSAGAVIVACFKPLGGFGSFCSVIVALGVIANSVPGTYSAALGCQVMGRYGKLVPRWLWSWLLVLLELVLALAGREHLYTIFSNFLALMGYWVEFMTCIVLLEHLGVVRKKVIDWSRWEDKAYLPVGWAALASFLLGWTGAILGMSQDWYVGPLAKLSSGADVGVWVGCGFSLLSFPPLRYLELKYIGR